MRLPLMLATTALFAAAACTQLVDDSTTDLLPGGIGPASETSGDDIRFEDTAIADGAGPASEDTNNIGPNSESEDTDSAPDTADRNDTGHNETCPPALPADVRVGWRDGVPFWAYPVHGNDWETIATWLACCEPASIRTNLASGSMRITIQGRVDTYCHVTWEHGLDGASQVSECYFSEDSDLPDGFGNDENPAWVDDHPECAPM